MNIASKIFFLVYKTLNIIIITKLLLNYNSNNYKSETSNPNNFIMQL